MRRNIWRLLLALCAPAVAACDATGSDRLTSEDVAGVYTVCTLVFQPEGAQQPVDIRAAAFDSSRQHRLGVDVSPRTFELEYTPRGQFTDRELRGTYDLREEGIELRFGTSDVAASSLLLPERIPLDYSPSPQSLSMEATPAYNVPRSDYARLAGISEAGLAERIPGRLKARFQAGGCL